MSRRGMALLLLNGVLLLALAGLWFTPQGEPRRSPWQAPAALPPELPSLSVSELPAVDLGLIVARPLFSADRRPPPPPAAPPPPDPMANIELLGVLGGDYAGVIARVDGKSQRLRVNDTLGEWTLVAVEGRRATFKRQTEERHLDLAFSRLGGAAATTATAATAATAAAPASNAQASADDTRRERLRRRNEIRARAGLPPIPE